MKKNKVKLLETGTGINMETMYVIEQPSGQILAVNHRSKSKGGTILAQVIVYGPRFVTGSQSDYWQVYKDMAMRAAGFDNFY